MAVRFQPRFDPMDGPEHTPPERQSEDPTAWFDRYFAIPGLLFTSLVCYALLGLQLSGFRGSEGLLAWTTNNGSAITIGVQVLSHILGLVHVQVICEHL